MRALSPPVSTESHFHLLIPLPYPHAISPLLQSPLHYPPLSNFQFRHYFLLFLTAKFDGFACKILFKIHPSIKNLFGQNIHNCEPIVFQNTIFPDLDE